MWSSIYWPLRSLIAFLAASIPYYLLPTVPSGCSKQMNAKRAETFFPGTSCSLTMRLLMFPYLVNNVFIWSSVQADGKSLTYMLFDPFSLISYFSQIIPSIPYSFIFSNAIFAELESLKVTNPKPFLTTPLSISKLDFAEMISPIFDNSFSISLDKKILSLLLYRRKTVLFKFVAILLVPRS